MLTPDYVRDKTDQSEENASQFRTSIISLIVRRMMARIGRGVDYLLTATDRWQIDILQDAGMLLEDIQKELISFTKVQEKEVKAAMEESGIKALLYDDKI